MNNLAAYLQNCGNAALTLFYPRGCRLCGASVENLADGAACRECWLKTRIFDGSETLCAKCGRLLEHAGRRAEKTFCHLCDNDFYDAARAVGIYENALRASILELKEKPFVSTTLKKVLQIAFDNAPFFNQITKIIPVPLHKRRFHERGFNQATLLAQILSSGTNLPLLENCLVRQSFTEMHRGAFDERARRESVENVFAVKQPRLIENENVLLVDDVLTSGATASASAKALKKSGAGAVFVLTVARAV